MRLLQSLTRGLEALDYLRANTEPVRLTEVAAALGVDKLNAAHVLKTLVAAGYSPPPAAAAAPRQPRGSGFTRRGDRGGEGGLVARCSGSACRRRRANARTWRCSWARMSGTSTKSIPPLPLKVDHPIGSLALLHCTALGKAFLAFGHAHPPSELVAFTPRTLTTKDALAEDLARIRRSGLRRRRRGIHRRHSLRRPPHLRRERLHDRSRRPFRGQASG